MTDIRLMAEQAREAAYGLAALPAHSRNAALAAMADALEASKEEIFSANQADVAAAEKERLSLPLLKRLKFDQAKLRDTLAGLHALIGLPDPLGQTQMARELEAGLNLYRVSCPIGVVGVIFESRPDALVQIASLCLKSGNAVLLKGGREALGTNRALYRALAGGAKRAGIPAGFAALLETRDDVRDMLALDDAIDLIIPRGSKEFVKYIMEHSAIPVLGHSDGLCHVYVDRAADIPMALRIAVDSKTQAVAVCNAMETLLVHQEIAPAFLPPLAQAMAEKGVELRGCPRARQIIACLPATPADDTTEYLDLILSIRVVDDLAQAIAHINRYGSGHTDCIVTQDDRSAAEFLLRVDSAGVYRNCSTRFADGYRYGLGAEVGIATGKLHARGPMGMEGLCTYKYKLLGSGQTVADLAAGKARLTHRDLDEACPL